MNDPLTRRHFLTAAGSLAFGLSAPWRVLASDGADGDAAESQPATQPTTAPTTQPDDPSQRGTPWWLGEEYKRSRVVESRAGASANMAAPDPQIIEDILGQAVQSLTGETSPESAWNKILGSAHRILINFDLTAARLINTTDPMARALVEQLRAADYHPRTVALLNAPTYLGRALGTRSPERGWGAAVKVGDGYEQVANYVLEADAVINVPFLIAHPVTGVSCCVHCLANAALRHPGRYYRDDRERQVSQILLDKRVSSKVRINIVNALRIVLNHGSDATEDDVAAVGEVLAGFDPVATDVIAFDLLMRERREAGVDAKVAAPYLEDAVEWGIGRRQANQIEHVLTGAIR